MKKTTTVKKKIFKNNNLMIIFILGICLIINIGIAKIYTETVEQKWSASMERVLDKEQMKELLEDWTLQQRSFQILFGIDVILCLGVLIGVSRVFANFLTTDVMEPLDELSQGADRIKEDNLDIEINYQGMEEFENVCNNFNGMQKYIKTEQEKNSNYEKARTRMVAGISHDLKTPLTAIKGTIKGLLDGVAGTPEQQNKFLEISYKRTEEMERLLNQLFYFSKLETGNMPLDLQKVDLYKFIKDYSGEKQLITKECTINVEYENKQEKIYGLIDIVQTQRIFDNLLENSIKHGKATPTVINIKLERKQEKAVIAFKDNGVGVEKEKLAFIFDEFFCGDESRKEKNGTGLELHIVKTIVESMGGDVRAESDKGLSVIIELPVSELKVSTDEI